MTQQSAKMAAPEGSASSAAAVHNAGSLSCVAHPSLETRFTVLILGRGHYLHPRSRLREQNSLRLPLCRLIFRVFFFSSVVVANLALQLYLSDFSAESLHIHLADLQQKAFSVGLENALDFMTNLLSVGWFKALKKKNLLWSKHIG